MPAEHDTTQAPAERSPKTHAFTRRRALIGVGGTAAAILVGPSLFAGSARADAATGTLDIAGDSLTTDNGVLQSLHCTLSGGHVSYDGLDTPADTIAVRLYAAPSGGDTDTAGNEIAASTFTVADESGLNTHAGSIDVTFSAVDVLAAQDLNKADFKSNTDGATQNTSLDFRLEVVVKDVNGTVLVEGDDMTTATISVTNEARTTGVEGAGSTVASGANQRP